MDNGLLRRAIACNDAGEWAAAHALVNEDEQDRVAMWLHAWLHRIEGDAGNARYWYRKAGRSPFAGSVAEERDALLAALDDRAADTA